MTIDISDSWSKLYETRKVIRENFPDFWKMRVIRKPMWAIRRFMKEGDLVLDAGSYNRGLYHQLKTSFQDVKYRSMDIDRDKKHDYYSFEEIKEKFDIVFLFEVIEHLNLQDGVILLKKIHHVLKDKGKIILTTPNVFHPNRYWECSHKVSYRHDEIGGIMDSVGFNVVQIYRVYNDSFLKRMFRIYIASFVHEYFSVDFAKSILLVGEKK
ncbi:MAG: methyltransferase domain-containing protein [Candidatus Aureabacteria bacterium]|nr:methyltransferase domain-containing protein [Candidatus Auribacterota bacterium]